LATSDSQDSPRPKLQGSHHLPPYIILYASPQGPHPNGFLSHDSQVGVLKFPNLGFPQLWGHITWRADLRSWWGLRQICNHRRNFSNNMLHVACWQGNRVDFWLLVVGSQTNNLTPGLSVGHNLCFKCPNGWSKPILNI
jgi:hypothetical protein